MNTAHERGAFPSQLSMKLDLDYIDYSYSADVNTAGNMTNITLSQLSTQFCYAGISNGTHRRDASM